MVSPSVGASSDRPRAIRVGLVGTGKMAAAHSEAFASAAVRRLGVRVERRRLAGRTRAAALRTARAYEWSEATSDWRTITRADDIDVVDVVTPNHLHTEVVLDAVAHGKHVLCEKPLALDGPSALAMLRAAQEAGVVHQVAYPLRRWPAVSRARQLVADGRIGRVLTAEAHLRLDALVDPEIPMSWRLRRATAGSGSLGDLGSHVIDLLRFVLGDEVRSVAAYLDTSVRQRRLAESGEVAEVDVDDHASLLLRFEAGATAVVRVSWAAAGHKHDLGFEISGEIGALRFDWRRADELEILTPDTDGLGAGFRAVPLAPPLDDRPTSSAGPGTGLGFADMYVLQALAFLRAVIDHCPASPDFLDGARACEVIDAALQSAASGRVVDLADHPASGPNAHRAGAGVMR